MVGGSVRMTSVWQQTIALLWKNLLLKWRRKWHSILEWLQDLAYVLLMFLVAASAQVSPMNEFSPYAALGRVDSFTSQNFTVGYISTAPTARETMRRVAESQDLPGWTVQEFEDEEALLSEVKNHTAIAVIFHHPFQYHIRFSVYNISSPNDYTSYQGVCSNISENCYPTFYWSTGFLFLQAKIDSAIIEMTTSHMVQEQLTSIMVGRMASTQYSHSLVISVGIFVFGMCLSYVSMMYLLSLYVTRERMEMGTIMKTMRLKERAFWLSWGFLYLIYVIIIANLMTLVTGFFVFTRSSYGVILLLFILYGIASICVTFMLSALFRNPRVTAIAGFFITLLTSASGLLLLMKNLPKAVEVLLCIFPPFAFSVGLVESVHMEDDLRGVFFSHLTDVSSHIVFCCISLMVDSLLYGLLTLYFSKVLPGR
ncbi:ABC-type organic anion transporter ABCA8-like [Hyla sarda]|uniref:ABC-type organic anion transporter ABCA8-like n=1 Tax=Hyla sarda TaxID=327740 RepID=UPI0024C214DE|nr:ABC-type organic anion transporter ABCA8-like [Hyla sarda]